jgi:ATP phosphoribosyltransferase regulatory subunit
MTAEGAIKFEALEAQAASLMGLFVDAGYERVAPSFIQPAGIFLDRIGETLRARTYVFTDPNGEELCLRPDLTIPVARVFLERGARSPSKFCYNGPAFRIQEGKPDPLRPREFRQAGIEHFGSKSADADLEVFALTVDAIRRSGVGDFVVRTGHPGLFSALLNALDIPSRWRDRLARAFWRPAAFAKELAILAGGKAERPSLPASALSEDGFFAYIDSRAIPFIGSRRPHEIVSRLNDKAADASAPPMPRETVRLLENYLRVAGPVPKSLVSIYDLLFKAGLDRDLGPVLASAVQLYKKLEDLAGSAPVFFAADFGRHFEYYTGMVFQIEIEGAGIAGQIAGGGRYDGLVRALSDGVYDVPAVGAAIHTERLLAAASTGV